MNTTLAKTRDEVAEEIYKCPVHGIKGTYHTEIRWSLPVNGLHGQYDPGEEYEVVICNECNCEVKPEIDWSLVMDDLPY
jgi:hypothetical protein